MTQIPVEQANWLREIDTRESYENAGLSRGDQSANSMDIEYTLVTNSVSPTKVEDNGDHYLIQDVPIVKAMQLAGGYVPEWSIEETANAWAGTVPTLNHPRDNQGEPIAANRKPELHIGDVVESYFDGEFTRGDIKITKNDLNRLGGEAEQIKANLENGNPIDVSSQYKAEQLPPGEYDGQYRENVERIVEPDSVAILPNKTGKCTISDGCGINPEMVANADVSLTCTDDPSGEDVGQTQTMQANLLETARTPTFDGTTTGEWSKPDFSEYVAAFGYEDVSEVGELTDEQAQEIAETTLLGDPDADTFDDLQFFPVVEPDSMNLSENALMAVLSGRGAQADISQSQLDSARSVARTLLEDEFDRDMSSNSAFNKVLTGLKAAFGLTGEQTTNDAGGNSGADDDKDTPMSDLKNEDLINDLVSNTEFDRENLVAWDGTDCLENLHSEYVGNSDKEDEQSGDNTEEVVMTENELESLIEEKAEEVVANREEQSEKEQLVDEIVANSAEYDEDDKDELRETPKNVLERLASDVGPTAPSVPGRGVSANTGGSNDADEWASPIASDRLAEKEGDD